MWTRTKQGIVWSHERIPPWQPQQIPTPHSPGLVHQALSQRASWRNRCNYSAPLRSEAERKEAEARARAEELSLFIAEKSEEAMRVFDEASEEFENNGPSQRYKDLIDLYEELKKERDKAREEYKTLTEERSYPLPDDNDVPPIPLPEPLGTGEPGVPVPIGPIDPSPLDYDTGGEFSRRVRNKLKMREKPKHTNLDIGPNREE